MGTIEEPLERRSSGSGLENLDYVHSSLADASHGACFVRLLHCLQNMLNGYICIVQLVCVCHIASLHRTLTWNYDLVLSTCGPQQAVGKETSFLVCSLW
jgi:hypothetical protein